MLTSDFINLFKTGKLGKKKQHSGYRAMDGDHCQLLVRSTRSHAQPDGSELIGIYFGDDICIFHKNFSRLQRSVRIDVSDPKPVLTNAVMDENNQNLIESGVIGFDEDGQRLLVEIGDTPWLFENDPLYENHHFKWKYNTVTQVSRRVETVAKAAEDTALPKNQISNIGRFLQVMPSDFLPIATSENDIKLLMDPPSPFDYGFTLEDCIPQTFLRHKGVVCRAMGIRIDASHSDNGQAFKKEATAYNSAIDRFDKKTPIKWEELRCNDNGAILLAENGSVYIKGHVISQHTYSRTEEGDFATWHKVLGKSNRIRLGPR